MSLRAVSNCITGYQRQQNGFIAPRLNGLKTHCTTRTDEISPKAHQWGRWRSMERNQQPHLKIIYQIRRVCVEHAFALN
jgi:hypothetical protein